MKHLTLIFLILLSVQFAFAQDEQKTGAGNLTVIITGLKSNDGVVRVGLYNSRENYEGEEKPFRGMEAAIQNKKASVVFENIPFGEYAVKVYHDENSNRQLDKNFMGIPTEAYGFSNNAEGMFGPADYDDAKFLFDKDKVTIEIDVD